MQVDLGPVVQRTLEFRLLAFAQRLHRALKQFHIQRESDLLDLAALALAQQFTRTADLEVVRRKHETCAEILQ